jgi:hypothetical protein
MDLSPKTVTALRQQLQSGLPLNEVLVGELAKKLLVPKSLPFGPDLCLTDKKHAHLIYALAAEELPKWVVQAQDSLKRFPQTYVTVLAVHTPNVVGYKNASKVAERCIALGYGLATESDDGCFLVFPPAYSIPTPAFSKSEIGHLPSWIRTELLGVTGLGDYLLKALGRLNADYEKATKDGQFSYDDECEILMTFAHALRKGDRRLFVPVDQLTVLKEFEHAGGNPGARDHFFHTFNDLLIGLYLLNGLVPDRKRTAIPDRYIAPIAGTDQPNLRPWESLWALTCLFHDPGYMGENYWSNFSVALGAHARIDADSVIPDTIVSRINNAWETEFLEARQDLSELFRRVAGVWQLAGTSGGGPIADFDPALRRAYFDGRKCGHSLVSGLNLIKLCRGVRGVRHPTYEAEKALKATIIAALSMMFHDTHARHTLRTNGVPPIAFEDLPYATTLMFADALQDDRRDIATSTFPKEGVLQSLSVKAGHVLATVSLPQIPVKYWPGKIVEYQSVTGWINSVSDTKFKIDYRSEAGL